MLDFFLHIFGVGCAIAMFMLIVVWATEMAEKHLEDAATKKLRLYKIGVDSVLAYHQHRPANHAERIHIIGPACAHSLAPAQCAYEIMRQSREIDMTSSQWGVVDGRTIFNERKSEL